MYNILKELNDILSLKDKFKECLDNIREYLTTINVFNQDIYSSYFDNIDKIYTYINHVLELQNLGFGQEILFCF